MHGPCSNASTEAAHMHTSEVPVAERLMCLFLARLADHGVLARHRRTTHACTHRRLATCAWLRSCSMLKCGRSSVVGDPAYRHIVPHALRK